MIVTPGEGIDSLGVAKQNKSTLVPYGVDTTAVSVAKFVICRLCNVRVTPIVGAASAGTVSGSIPDEPVFEMASCELRYVVALPELANG